MGLPRTGLTSLRVALGQLLGGPCHHSAELFEGDEAVLDFWMKALDGKAEREDWVGYFQRRGYKSCVDVPSMIFYKYDHNLKIMKEFRQRRILYHIRELMQMFPEAKVVLTVRDPPSWYRSLRATVYEFVKLWESWPIRALLWVKGQRKLTLLQLKMKEKFPGK